jgi:hypothetical protein
MKGTNEHLGISGAPLTLPDLPKPIRNRDLTLADVPAFDVRTLNLDWREGPSMPQWFELLGLRAHVQRIPIHRA